MLAGPVNNRQTNSLKCSIVWLAAKRMRVFRAHAADPAATGEPVVPLEEHEKFLHDIRSLEYVTQAVPGMPDASLLRGFLGDLSTTDPRVMTDILADPVWHQVREAPGEADADWAICPLWAHETSFLAGNGTSMEVTDDFCPPCRQSVVAQGHSLDQHFQSQYGTPRKPYEYLDMANLDDFLNAQ